MTDKFRIGVITSTHGIKGEVKVFPTTDDVKRFEYLKKCYILYKNNYIEMEKNTVKYFKNMAIISFKGFNDINDIEKYKQCEIYVDREEAVPLEEGEYYIADIIGATVFLEDGTVFGTLKDVMQTGANDVLVVNIADDKEVLLPVIDECVLELDAVNSKVVVRIMKGLID